MLRRSPLESPSMIAFATYSGLPDGTPDDRLLLPALAERGIDVRFVAWDDAEADWTAFRCVVVRSTWDYYRRPADFLIWLDRLEAAGSRVFNSIEVMRPNVDKRYLRDLQHQGVHVVDTEWIMPGESVDLRGVMTRRGWSEAVAKPAVSAGAFETFRVSASDAASHQARLGALAERGAILVQPFLPEIAADGEWSLVYFDGRFSHATLKRAQPGDFRVQLRYGGTESGAAAPPAARLAADRLMGLLPKTPLFARVDGVMLSGAFALMELELIEPALFFHCDAFAPARFADALVNRL